MEETMTNAYGFDERINFPLDPYDKCIYLDQYQCCWEYQEHSNKWINLDATTGEKHGSN